MRRTLILGGTAWLGRQVAKRLLERGDVVTCLARGTSGATAPGVRFIEADRSVPGAYDRVRAEPWDDVIELSWNLAFVTEALESLAGGAGHWTLVSSVSVYAENTEANADESATVVEPAADVGGNDYAQSKVAAERATRERVDDDRLLIVRPGLIGGPGDESDRFGYWVGRMALAGSGAVLTPTLVDRSVQVIDVRDLADWIVAAGVAGHSGTINALGREHSLADVLARAASLAAFGGALVEAPDEWLGENDVNHWMGARSLPLWLPASETAFAKRSNAAYQQAGGHLRDLNDTLRDCLADERRRGLDRDRRSGLARGDELALLDAWADQARETGI